MVIPGDGGEAHSPAGTDAPAARSPVDSSSWVEIPRPAYRALAVCCDSASVMVADGSQPVKARAKTTAG